MMRPLIVTWLLITLLSANAAAESLRCGNDLILPGDRKVEVLQACGEPAFVDRWEEKVNRGFLRYGHFWDNWEKVEVEEWTYNFGPRRFLYFIRFENGQVAKIETGDYGY